MLLVEGIFLFRGRREGDGKADCKRFAKGMAVFGGLAFLAFLPQVLFWRKLYGNSLQMPKMEEMDWLLPRIDLTLFSTYHGLIAWSPVLLLVVPGLWFLIRENRLVGAAFAMVVAAQVYVNSANEVWWAGGSFGNRRFVDYSFIFLLAIAACCRRWRGHPLFWTLTAVGTLWNFGLLGAERSHVLTVS